MDHETIHRTIAALRKLREFVSHNPRISQESLAVREFMKESSQLIGQLLLEAPPRGSVDTAPNP